MSQRFCSLARVFIAALLLASFAALPARAMRVDMTTIVLNPSEHVHGIDALNDGDRPAIVQVDAERVAVSETGVVSAQPTDDLIIAPRVFTLEANAKQELRIAWRSEPTDGEGLYRLKIRQVGNLGSSNITAAIHADFNVFVITTNPVFTKADVTAQMARLDGGHVQLSFSNAGERHARMGRIVVARPGAAPDLDGEPFTILPGKSRRAVTLPLLRGTRPAEVNVTYELDGRKITTTFDVP